MSNTLVVKVPEKVNTNDLEKEIKSRFQIPKEFILVIDIESKKDLKKLSKPLRKIIKKSKLNAKYFEELIPVENIRHTTYYRNFGIY